MRQLAFELSAAPAPSFDNFVEGRNAESFAAVRAAAAGAAREQFLYLWGPKGSGKSHLLEATAGELKERGWPVALVRNEAQLLALDSGVAGAALIVDDVHLLSAPAQAELFKLHNALRESGGLFVAAGIAPPAGLPLRADLLTRLGWGLVYQLHPLSDEEMASALAEHARRRAFPLAREVISYVLTRQRRDLPHLISLVDALDRYSLETKRPVTVPLVRELLAQGSEPP
jgi:DnaA-homolog protein